MDVSLKPIGARLLVADLGVLDEDRTEGIELPEDRELDREPWVVGRVLSVGVECKADDLEGRCVLYPFLAGRIIDARSRVISFEEAVAVVSPRHVFLIQ